MRTFVRADISHKAEFQIHKGIDSALMLLKHRLKANGDRPEIAVIKEYGDLPPISCYPGQLNQVFMNILANAIDALEESHQGHSSIDIAAHPNRIKIQTRLDSAGKQVIIHLQDNGAGMSDEVRQRVFDHLFTTKAVGQGTGLGLEITRQIVVEKHGGAIAVESAIGQGSTFTISLPR